MAAKLVPLMPVMCDVIRDFSIPYLPSYTTLFSFPFSIAEASKTGFCNDASTVASLPIPSRTEGLLGTRNKHDQLVNTPSFDFRK